EWRGREHRAAGNGSTSMMQNRTLIWRTVVVVALLVGCEASATAQARNVKPLPTGRQSPAATIINAGSKFTRADVPGAAKVSFDDSAWQRIRIPHTWNNLDGQDGGNDY